MTPYEAALRKEALAKRVALSLEAWETEKAVLKKALDDKRKKEEPWRDKK